MSDTFSEWVILELLGHRRLAGFLTEQQIAGASFLRLDIPTDKPCEGCEPGDADPCQACHGLGSVLTATQFYAPGSVYAITPTTEDIARAAARYSRPAPVQLWGIEAAKDDPDNADDDGRSAWGSVV